MPKLAYSCCLTRFFHFPSPSSVARFHIYCWLLYGAVFIVGLIDHVHIQPPGIQLLTQTCLLHMILSRKTLPTSLINETVPLQLAEAYEQSSLEVWVQVDISSIFKFWARIKIIFNFTELVVKIEMTISLNEKTAANFCVALCSGKELITYKSQACALHTAHHCLQRSLFKTATHVKPASECPNSTYSFFIDLRNPTKLTGLPWHTRPPLMPWPLREASILTPTPKNPTPSTHFERSQAWEFKPSGR